LSELPPEPCTGLEALQKDVLMIFSVLVSIKEIVAKGRDFPWPRPRVCPRCHSDRMWGHGFVTAIFDGFLHQVLVKRWRCPECHCVLRVRPRGYFPRFQAPTEKIRSSIAFRLEHGRWPPGISRTRQGHWLRSLARKVCGYLGQAWRGHLLDGFDHLIRMNQTPVSRRM